MSEIHSEHMAGSLKRQNPDGAMGYLLQYPEITMEPSIEEYDNTIIFTHGDENTYTNYINRLKHIFKAYDVKDNIIDCRNITGYRSSDTWNQSCRFDPIVELTDPGHLCSSQFNYGFDESLPCIVIGFDRVLNWIPERYTRETIPDKIRDKWVDDSIAVTCEGTDPVSVDNVFQIETFPQEGFQYKYFPYTGQSEWRTPLVQVVVFAARGVTVEIRCTVWAKNIFQSDLISTGSVKFTILEL